MDSMTLPIASFSLAAAGDSESEEDGSPPPPSSSRRDRRQHKSGRHHKGESSEREGRRKSSSAATAASSGDFRSMNLPVASFSARPRGTDEKKSESPSSKARQDKAETPKREERRKSTGGAGPLPKSTKAGRKWVDAVSKTREHHRYEQWYDFDRFKQLDREVGCGGEGSWIKAKPFGDWCAGNPQVVAIDCEMCETEDPVSGQRDSKALCRISLVNGEDENDVLLDTLVKPAWPVSNYRTFVNGITAESLENVHFTLRHAQAFLMALCSDQTVIVGHAVYNDLAALRMEHHCVADTACLYVAEDSDWATVSLKDLAKNVMGLEMPDVHDSVNDAATALRCARNYVDKAGRVDPIRRSNASKKPSYASQLFVHRIPKRITDESHISRMFLAYTHVQPSEVEEIDFSGAQGKTLVSFPTPRHASLAFDTLTGKAVPDNTGRLQKNVYLKGGDDYVRVRKMAFERDDDRNNNDNNNRRRRDNHNDSNDGRSKRRRMSD